MTRTMYDGITAADVPDGWGVAGYTDGNWPDYTALTLRWPHAVHISVAVTAADDAWALDVENYDATPAQAPGWVSRQRDRGNPYPWVYMNASTWPEVVYEFAQQKVAAPLYWVAQYDGLAVVPPGAIAKQHTNTPGYDISVVADHVPGIDPAPTTTAPAATTEEEDDMAQIDSLTVRPDGQYALDVPDGKTQIRLTADGNDGPGAQLRLAFWEHDNPLVTGASPNPVQVGGSSGHHTIGIPLPAGCTGITVSREDHATFPVALGFHA